MVGISMPGLLAIGYVVALVLLFLANREREDLNRKSILAKSGVILIGIMIAITPLSWYGYYAATDGSIAMALYDLAIVSMCCIFGGIIIGAGLRAKPPTN
jgi:drug/metabolite transporter (DMT)-like permease